jgi:chromosome segregation ATPase
MRRLAQGLLLTLLVSCVAPVAAQEAPAETTPVDLSGQLERLNSALERIADALDRQTKLDLLARRIELSAARVAVLEKRLLDSRAAQASLETERQRIDGRIEAFRSEVSEGLVEATSAELELATRTMDAELGRVKAREGELAAQVAELENRLAGQRAEHDDWLAYLDRLISDL